MRRPSTLTLTLTWTLGCLFACDGADDADAARSTPDAGDDGRGGERPPPEPGGGSDGDGGSGGEEPLPEIGPFEPSLDASQETGSLTTQQIETLCAEVGAYVAGFDAEVRALRCLDFAVTTTLVGSGDPATCERLRPGCATVPLEAESLARECVSAFENREFYCTSTSMETFAGCVTENLQREIAGADAASLTCEAAVAQGGVMPEGRRDCICDVPLYVGPPPADDLDRDGVPSEDDHCPETPLYHPVSDVGCAVVEDDDQDGVLTRDDRCTETPAGESVGEAGCSRSEDADQDGVPNLLDRCDATAEGDEVNEQGCGPSDDRDADGVPDAVDACLDTPAGEPVSERGCARSQDADGDSVGDAVDRCPGTLTPVEANEFGCDQLQDADDDGVPEAEDHCPSTGVDGDTVVNRFGCSVSQDRDQDGVENFTDQCEDTPPGAEVSAAGCARSQDEDGDVVLNPVDACPFTPDGAPVDRDGCTVDQRASLGAPLDGPPPGAVALRLGADLPTPITMFAMPDVVGDGPDGSRTVQGNLMLQFPTGQVISMPRANVRFSEAAPGAGDTFGRIDGTLDVPLPAVGLLDGLRLHAPTSARIRLDRGSAPDLQVLGARLDPDRAYLVFNLEVGIEADIGPLTFTVGESRELLLVIDPLDPGFYVRTNCDGLPYLSRLSDVGVGFSLGGRIPFVPASTWGVEEAAQPFDGHLAVDASAELLSGLPAALAQLVVSGEAVLDIDADRDGRSAFQTGRLDDGVRLGVNGEVTLELQFFGTEDAAVGLPLAQASLGLESIAGRHTGWASGRVGPDEVRLPVAIPVAPAGELTAAIRLAEFSWESVVRLAGRFELQASRLPVPGLTLHDVVLDGEVIVDASGVRLVGRIDRSIHDSIEIGPGGVMLDAQMTWSGLSFHLSLEGEMTRDGRAIDRVDLGP
jgi:hypothetical protein